MLLFKHIIFKQIKILFIFYQIVYKYFYNKQAYAKI